MLIENNFSTANEKKKETNGNTYLELLWMKFHNQPIRGKTKYLSCILKTLSTVSFIFTIVVSTGTK